MIYEYHAEDSPQRVGYEPSHGEQVWTFLVPLAGGNSLRLVCGSATRQSLIHVLTQEEIDNTLEEVLDGANGD